MPALDFPYDLSMRLLRRFAPLLEKGSSKLAQGLRGRIGARDVLHDWGEVYRDPERAMVWMHAPSVGEGFQAKAVLEALVELRPDVEAAFTFFSPSAVAFAKRMPVHVAGYLPWDIRLEMEEIVRALDVGLVAFTKTEVWPGLTAAAVGRGVPVVLQAATLSEGSGRLRLPGKTLLGSAFRSLAEVLAISEEDAGRFERLGVPSTRIQVTGDPAVDSAWRRAREANPKALYLTPFIEDRRPTLVAGSTWWEDERILIPVLGQLRAEAPDLRVIVAPHEPGELVVSRLEADLSMLGMKTLRLGELEATGRTEAADAVIVDRVGALAHLYTVGDMAYVGGAFGRNGIHSVLEPAAAGLPVVFGPRCQMSRSAADLIEAGAAISVADVRELVTVVRTWLRDRRKLEEAAGRASGYIEGHRGAAEKTAVALARHLPPSKESRLGAVETGDRGDSRDHSE